MKPSPQSPRMFQSDFLDFFSRSPWWSVPLVWLPICGYLIYLGPKDSRLALILVGIFVWSLTEYLLHRFVFHYEFQTQNGQYVHFLIHGVHHQWPRDKYRLVMPISVGMIIATPFALFYWFLLGPVLFYPFFAGFLLGYVGYDCIHYALHHMKSQSAFFKALRKHHMMHHHNKTQMATTKFGVSSSLWDRVFRTL